MKFTRGSITHCFHIKDAYLQCTRGQGKPKRQGILCRINVIRCPRGLRPMGSNAGRPIVPDIFFFPLLRYLARECGEYSSKILFCNGTRKRDDKIFIIIQGVTGGVTQVARLPES